MTAAGSSAGQVSPLWISFFSPHFLVSSLEGSHFAQPMFEEMGVTFHLLEGRVSTQIIRDSVQEFWLFSPSFPFIQSFISEWTCGYCLYALDYNPISFCFSICWKFPVWPLEDFQLSSVYLCNIAIMLFFVCLLACFALLVLLLVVPNFLVQQDASGSVLILLPSPRISHFS